MFAFDSVVIAALVVIALVSVMCVISVTVIAWLVLEVVGLLVEAGSADCKWSD